MPITAAPKVAEHARKKRNAPDDINISPFTSQFSGENHKHQKRLFPTSKEKLAFPPEQPLALLSESILQSQSSDGDEFENCKS